MMGPLAGIRHYVPAIYMIKEREASRRVIGAVMPYACMPSALPGRQSWQAGVVHRCVGPLSVPPDSCCAWSRFLCTARCRHHAVQRGRGVLQSLAKTLVALEMHVRGLWKPS